MFLIKIKYLYFVELYLTVQLSLTICLMYECSSNGNVNRLTKVVQFRRKMKVVVSLQLLINLKFLQVDKNYMMKNVIPTRF